MQKENSTPEHWRDVAGYEGFYQVSNRGQVRSLDRISCGKRLRGRMMELEPGDGYLRAKFRAGNGQRKYSVHILVALAFIGPKPVGHQVAHKDGNRANNHVENLRWATPKENHADRLEHGTAPRGEQCGMSKLTECDVHQIRRLLSEGLARKTVATRFGVSQSAISKIKHGHTWWYLPHRDLQQSH